MPGKIGVKIKAARNLPIMDKSSDTTDAFVEIKLGSVTHKTDVFRKSLNPKWNTDWFRFEVDDAELQDEPLQIRLMDYDTYSANDAIGKVNISLNPLCLENTSQAMHGKGTVLSGWIPVFDTMHGIRGEINVIVKVDLFSDANKFRQSSCGIPFFHSQCVPHGYRAQVIHGFVEELVVNDDPEYQWIDKIRTPRASNEARQVVFLKLSGQVQRKMGLKAINMGANAVIGYTQCFDLEGDVGVVARGVGTAVTLIKDQTTSQPSTADVALIEEASLPLTGRTPQYRLSICRQANAASAGSMFYLESASSDNDDVEIMRNLIRQEDERGEKVREKKLRHRMRRITLSSRNVFSEKYATLIRRIEPKIPENASRSLSNLFSSNYDLRKRRRSTKGRLTPAIVRSLSEDTRVRSQPMCQLEVPTLTDFQDSARSAPNIPAPKSFTSLATASSASLALDSTCTLERTDSESELDEFQLLDDDNDVDADDLQVNWIKPGETRSRANSQCDEEPEHHSLMHDLKNFSRRVQQFMHITPKEQPTALPLLLGQLWSTPSLERKPYYSSQPELPNCGTDHVQSSCDAGIRRCVSFNNIAKISVIPPSTQPQQASLLAAAVSIDQSAPPLVTSLHNLNSLLLNAPELRICPSTPTESSSSLLSPQRTLGSSSNNSSNIFTFSNSEFVPPNRIPQQHVFHISNSTNNNNNNNNHHSNNNNESSLLAPCYSVSPFAIQQKPLQRSTRSSSDLQALQPTTIQQLSTSPPIHPSAENSPNIRRGVLANRLKLTPSPSKSGISAANADSASTSTTSTATTMVPKEMGEICRRSSDSDLSVTPKGNSICVASERLVAATALMRLTQTAVSSKGTESLDMLEYPFLTMTKYPTGFILHLGATVAARSVKLLERVPNPDEPEVRDSWWTELRMEIRSHARSLGCNVVLGYAETTTISDDVCVLSATGTAAVINMVFNRSVSQTDIFAMSKATNAMSNSQEERDAANGSGTEGKDNSSITNSGGKRYNMPPLSSARNNCAMCHIPYNLSSMPFNIKMKKCAICRKGRVPDVLLATLEVPEYLQVTGRGCFMQAQVVRAKRDLRAELNAKEISDGLPFLEYELHRVLINKLKAKGMNAIFGLRTQVAIGERMIALIATGTALFLTALPVPQVPKIVAGNSWTDKQKLNELQKKLQETFERNQEIYQLKNLDPDLPTTISAVVADRQSDTDESDDEEMNEIDLNCGNKELCVLEVDDIEDLEIISLLMEPYPPEGFHVVNTQQVPGLIDMDAVRNLQLFTQVWRARLEVGQSVNGFPKHFQRLLSTIYFKLRTMIPCAICDLRFRLDLPETDQIQLLVTGMAMGLSDSNKMKYRRKLPTHHNGLNDDQNSQPELNGKRNLQEEDYIFPLDEDQMVDTPTPTSSAIPPFGMGSFKARKASPSRLGTLMSSTTKPLNLVTTPRSRYFPLRDRFGVDLTPLSFIPGGRIDKYLGNLNFFFIRESTSIREHGGISGFVHGFITELLAVVRAHIASLGGNAMVSFYMTELILFDNQHKNQGQCLISIGGDAVYVSYYADD